MLAMLEAQQSTTPTLLNQVGVLVKNNNYYSERLMDFADIVADLRELGPQVRAAEAEVASLSGDFGLEANREILLTVVPRLGEWRARLRSGATDALEKLILEKHKALWEASASLWVEPTPLALGNLHLAQRVLSEAAISFPFDAEINMMVEAVAGLIQEFGAIVKAGGVELAGQALLTSTFLYGDDFMKLLDALQVAIEESRGGVLFPRRTNWSTSCTRWGSRWSGGRSTCPPIPQRRSLWK